MNSTVNATGMQITAKSDNTFLLISSESTTASDIQAENGGEGNTSVALTVLDADSKLYPSAPCMTSAEAGYLTTSDKTVAGLAITTAGVQITNAATADAYTNWYTATANGAGSASMKTGSAVQLTSFTGYVIKKTVYLTVAVGANAAKDLSVTGTFTQKTGGSDVSACRALITTNDGDVAKIIDSATPTADIKGSNTNLTSSLVRIVNIYLFYDGNNSNVYTNNAANLTGAEISLSFSVNAVPAA